MSKRSPVEALNHDYSHVHVLVYNSAKDWRALVGPLPAVGFQVQVALPETVALQAASHERWEVVIARAENDQDDKIHLQPRQIHRSVLHSHITSHPQV